MAHRAQEITPSPWKSAADRRYETFLGQLSAKGRATVQKHDEQCEAQGPPAHCELWKRLAGSLGKLAGHATEVYGQHSVKFYIADGKYKQQVFALEDTAQGVIAVYFPDVVQTAISEKLLAAGAPAPSYKIPGSAEKLNLESIDADTRDLTICKAMVGWGRRALRAQFSPLAPEAHVQVVERMCELAAQKWAPPVA